MGELVDLTKNFMAAQAANNVARQWEVLAAETAKEEDADACRRIAQQMRSAAGHRLRFFAFGT